MIGRGRQKTLFSESLTNTIQKIKFSGDLGKKVELYVEAALTEALSNGN
jgi:hypothetical protein